MTARVITEETFNPDDYTEELQAAPENFDVGTKLWFENPSIRVWEVRLKPGERVVAEGIQKVKPGSMVSPKPYTPEVQETKAPPPPEAKPAEPAKEEKR